MGNFSHKKSSNVGENGIESIRLDGMKIQDLPIGLGNEAKEGLSDFIKTDKKNKIESIKAKYPKQDAEYLKASIKECNLNIERIKNFKSDLKNKISEYRQLIKDCDYRENQLNKYDENNPEDSEKMKELRLKYPPYDVDALNKQIEQFEEGIDRSDKVIEDEYTSISEIREVLVLVEQRDRELQNVK